MPSSRAVAFRADDGFELHGRLFGDPAAARYALLIVPAMGVPQRFYAAAPKRMDRIAPGDIGVRRIGHFGFFRKPFESTLWPRVAGWLNTPDLSPMETAR